MTVLRRNWIFVGLLVLVSFLGSMEALLPQSLPVPTTLEDFFLPGTQPDPTGDLIDPVWGAQEHNCDNCHGGFPAPYAEADPFETWASSMMAQAQRDPLFLASLTIANQDATDSGDLCLRCHSPAGWVGGRSSPTDGSALSEPADFEGVNCHFCHRMVDPVYEAGVSPSQDQDILAALATAGLLPLDFGSAKFVLGPAQEVRRGPLPGPTHPQGATQISSPFHSEASFCATCHDVSNPAFTRQPDGTYVPNDLDAAHPTLLEADMFPLERTYSEWAQSAFASGGVALGDRFGGNHPTGVMETCQDCHMPDQIGPAAVSGPGSGTIYADAPQHSLTGGNTWLLDAVRALHPDTTTGMSASSVAAAKARAVEMLQNASDLELTREGPDLRVRITNYGAHKLPTGYPEGRRMWINVRFLTGATVIQEHGEYDFGTAELDVATTKVYEAKLGLDATMAALTGLPEGESFHFALNNTWIKDNRIPPIGFTNAGFADVGAAPVASVYADGQHWDDTLFPIPPGATSAAVTIYYQTASKEYIEFLLNENVTDDHGQTLYDQWVSLGRGAPIEMDLQTIDFVSSDADFVRGDCYQNGATNLGDVILVLGILFEGASAQGCADACDVNDDGALELSDPIALLAYLFSSGTAPSPPFVDCGPDPTPDGLGCLGHSACP